MGRILCLHGLGCSGTIFEWQLASFMVAMESYHEFVFLDGEIDCEPAPGVNGIAPAPYLCYYDSVATPQILQAQRQVLSFIEDQGPFIGVIGFSQGSALAASILLHHSLVKPWDQPPFNFAIFFAGILPFSPDHSLYLDTIKDLVVGCNTAQNNNSVTSEKHQDDKSIPSEVQPDAELYRSLFCSFMGSEHGTPEQYFASLPTTDMRNAALAGCQENPLSTNSCRPYHPYWTQARIRVPTLHIVGKTDPFSEQAKMLYDLCSNTERNMVEHSGTHDVPRNKQDLANVVQAAFATIERSVLVAGGMIC